MTTPLAIDIKIGEHVTRKVGGLTFNVDTIWATVVAGAILVGLGLYMAYRVTHGTPSRLQLAFEVVVEAVQRQVEESMGPVAPFVVPLAVTLFLFILISNWIELVPSGHSPEYLPAPTADVNLTFALSFLVFGWAVVTGVRRRGAVRYVKHFFQPYWFLFPINMVEEIAKPFSLSLRLFGNIFAGGVIILLIAALPALIVPVPEVIWKIFDMFIGLIQAFIFALLTILYFGFAISPGDDGH